jgi:hypothetical protein
MGTEGTDGLLLKTGKVYTWVGPPATSLLSDGLNIDASPNLYWDFM